MYLNKLFKMYADERGYRTPNMSMLAYTRTYIRYKEVLEEFIHKYKTRPPDMKFWPYGPYWPPHYYGPLLPTPTHIRARPCIPEPLRLQETSRRTVDNQHTQYTHKWRGVQILYDSEKTPKEYKPPPVPDGVCPNLTFESRFECGNLRQARRVGQFEYELVLKTDLYTKRHTQWFYFRVQNAIPGITYKFRICNLLKKDSLYNHGMRPLIYTEKMAKKGVGWMRTGHHISYTRNVIHLQCPLLTREMAYYMLEWQMEFPQGDDTCYLAHCYPYTYSDLKTDLDTLLDEPDRSKVMKREVMCESRAGNSCFLVTVTNFDEDMKNKKGVIVTGRVHPGETNSSWMMRGLLDYISGPSPAAKELRKHYVFKIVPMLNPDGVIVGNYRCSLAARDLNRNYRHPRKESFPTIWHTKAMMEDMLRWNDVLVYCDLHGHSRKQNVFMYGCNVSGNSLNGAQSAEAFLQERLFPWLMSQKAPDKFNFNGCKFQIKRCKESTGRVVMFQQMKIDNSFTMEATFCGSTICKGTKRHFNTHDLEDMGRAFCDVVLDYHKAQLDKTKMSEVILDLTRAITQQILETRGLLPPNLPCLATQLGREKLKEMVECGEVKQVDPQKPLPSSPEKVTQNFVRLIEQHSNPMPASNNDTTVDTEETTKSSAQSKNHDSSKAAMNNMLNKLSEKTIDGCVRILEQLHLVESALESDSSDSDSESEPEMKWVEPRNRKKKKKKKSKRKETDSATKKQVETPPVQPSPPQPPPPDLGLPAIQSTDKERYKKQNPSMGKYVKTYVKSYPAYVNKYEKRSNGGIPCFSQERLTERAARKMQEMKKRMEDEQKQRDAMYYVGFDLESAQNALLPPQQLALPTQRVHGDPQQMQRVQVHLELRQQFHQALSGGTTLNVRTGYVHAPDNGNQFSLNGHHETEYRYQPPSNLHHQNDSSETSDSSDDEVDSKSKRIHSMSNAYASAANHLSNTHSHSANYPPPPGKHSSRGGFGHGRHASSAHSIPLPRTATNIMVGPVTKAASDIVSVSSSNRHLPKPNRPSSRNGTQASDDAGTKDDKDRRKSQPPLLSREYTDLLLDKLRMHKSSPAKALVLNSSILPIHFSPRADHANPPPSRQSHPVIVINDPNDLRVDMSAGPNVHHYQQQQQQQQSPRPNLDPRNVTSENRSKDGESSSGNGNPQNHHQGLSLTGQCQRSNSDMSSFSHRGPSINGGVNSPRRHQGASTKSSNSTARRKLSANSSSNNNKAKGTLKAHSHSATNLSCRGSQQDLSTAKDDNEAGPLQVVSSHASATSGGAVAHAPSDCRLHHQEKKPQLSPHPAHPPHPPPPGSDCGSDLIMARGLSTGGDQRPPGCSMSLLTATRANAPLAPLQLVPDATGEEQYIMLTCTGSGVGGANSSELVVNTSSTTAADMWEKGALP